MSNTLSANGDTALVPRQNGGRATDLPREVQLSLYIRDAEVITELVRFSDGPPRDEYASTALRLGVLALRQASGLIDSAAIREEGQRLVGGIRETMFGQSAELLKELGKLVASYFDPRTGTLPQRLEQLLRKDGDLERVLKDHLSGDTSTIAQTLAQHIGEQSPIFKILSPKQTDGLLAALKEAIDKALGVQRDYILQEFSLDNDKSALSRLVAELTDSNGTLKKELAEDVDKVVKEFSLDNEQGALTRLVTRVEKAQSIISGEFSLDNKDSALSRLADLLKVTNSAVAASLTLDDEKSPLSRLRNELLKVMQDLTKTNTEFRTEVRETLAALQARKQEAARSTRHGGEFEEAVGEMLLAEAQRLGDVFATVGETVGAKPRCKIGDHTVTLGQESAAPGAVIVCEAKEKQGVSLPDALKEIQEARENRRAQVGIFVFSKLVAPTGVEPLQRHGSDVVVVWDRENIQSDIYFRAALSLARALTVRECVAAERQKAELVELERAIMRIAKDAEKVEQIGIWAETAQSATGKICREAEQIRTDLDEQIERLRIYATGQRQGDGAVAA